MKKYLLAIMAGLALTACGGASEDSNPTPESFDHFLPAMWEISDNDTQVVVFGIVPTKADPSEWRTSLLDDAISKADQVYFMFPMTQDGLQDAAYALDSYGIADQENVLSSMVPAANKEQFERAAKSVGVGSTRLEPFRPWRAALTLTQSHLLEKGFDGPDIASLLAAEIPDRKERYFETYSDYFSGLADMDKAMASDYLTFVVRQIDDDPQYLSLIHI